MRVLVLGGTGFIGPWVVRRLVHLGCEVSVFHRGQHQVDLPADVRHFHGERRHLLRFRRTLGQFSPEVVLDMYAMGKADADEVVQTVDGIVPRVVAISSGDVYRAYDVLWDHDSGPLQSVPLTEDAELRERFYPYRGDTLRDSEDPERWLDDYEKILVERTVQDAAGIVSTVLRLPMVYGPGDDQHRLFRYIKRMDDRRQAILLGNEFAQWQASFAYVENVAAAIALAVTDARAAGRTYNISGRAVSMSEWIGDIGRLVDWHGDLVTFPRERLPPHLALKVRWQQHFTLDDDRIRQELGYEEAVPYGAGLLRTIAWERAHLPGGQERIAAEYAAEDAALTSAP